MTGEDILGIIHRRRSVRRFSERTLPDDVLQRIVAAGEGAPALGGGGMSFRLCRGGEVAGGVGGLAGDYGRVIRAPHFVVLSAEPEDGYLLDCGFRFQQLILQASALGVGTCWVGGFLREERLRELLGVDRRWRIVALTPLGEPSGRRADRLVDRAMKAAVGARRRKPLEEIFFGGEWGGTPPVEPAGRDTLLRLMEAVRWAPSWANRQPWRFVVREGEFFLYKAGTQMKEGKDYHLVDCGIAMCHLHLAARRLGVEGGWTVGGKGFPPAPEGHDPVARYRRRRDGGGEDAPGLRERAPRRRGRAEAGT